MFMEMWLLHVVEFPELRRNSNNSNINQSWRTRIYRKVLLISFLKENLWSNFSRISLTQIFLQELRHVCCFIEYMFIEQVFHHLISAEANTMR